ncbi:hypothetical protein HDV64DRAFT_262187 [Trichoderma sp. TUCIM 5745]
MQSVRQAICLIVLNNLYTCSRICAGSCHNVLPMVFGTPTILTFALLSALLVVGLSYLMQQVSKDQKSNKVSSATSTMPVLVPDVSCM